PYCIEATSYCVFTNAKFQGPNRGVSIIEANSSQATAVLASTASLHVVSSGAPEVGNESPPYQVQDIPGKGKGVVATRKISRGEVFMLDYAAVLVDTQMPSRIKRDQGRQLLREAIERLPAARKILDLARSSLDPDNVPAAEDVIKTNSFQVDIGGKGYMALFPEIARMNHACKPSALTRFNATTLSNTVTAFHDIHPGEEITISYTPFGLPSTSRQALLRQNWGFECACSLCASPPNELAASDARRKMIADLGQQVLGLVEKGSAASMKRAAELYSEVADAVREEGLVPHLGAHYEVLGRLYIAAGDTKKGAEMVRRAVDEGKGFE
ncbi:SET domain-containing protein, partial [Canariomyces notabilis]